MGNVQSRKTGMAIFVATLVIALGVACALALPAQKAYAEVFWASDNSWVVAPESDDNMTGINFIEFEDENGSWITSGLKIKNVKSSNKKVARVSKGDYYLYVEYGMTTGKTTFTCTVNGQKLSHEFEVKYTCPVKKFTVAGKSVMKTFKKKNVFVTKSTLKNKTAVVKAKKNWVITEVSLGKKGKYKYKEFPKGKRSYSAKISTPWPYDGISLKFKNTKTGEEQTLTYRKYYDIRYAQAG